MQGTLVQFLIQEDPTCYGANKPVHHSFWACVLEPWIRNFWAHMLQLLKHTSLELVSQQAEPLSEKPAAAAKEQPTLTTTRGKPMPAKTTQRSQK